MILILSMTIAFCTGVIVLQLIDIEKALEKIVRELERMR